MTCDVVLIDLCAWDGHHKFYFLRVLHALEEFGMRVAGLCLEREDCQKGYQDEFGEANSPKIIPLQAASSWFMYLVALLNQVWYRLTGRAAVVNPYFVENLLKTRRSLEKAGISPNTVVFFLHLDSMLLVRPTWLGKLLMPRRWIGLYFLPAFRTPREDSSYSAHLSREKVLQSKKCRGIYVLDEATVNDLEVKVERGFVEFLPELLDVDYEEGYQLPQVFHDSAEVKRPIVGMFGNLDKRKNVLNLVRAVSLFDEGTVQLVLMGKLDLSKYSEEEREEFEKLTKADRHIYTKFEFIPDEAFNKLISASDVIYAAYNNFVGSSGILPKAVFFRRPVLAARGFVIGDRVQQYKLGMTVEHDRPTEIAAAILTLTQEFELDETKAEAFLERNTSTSFTDHLKSLAKIVSRKQ